MNGTIILADLGHFKAYRVVEDPLKITSDKIELIKSYDSPEARTKASSKFSDAAGRFYLGGGTGGTAAGYGEPHNVRLEAEKRLIKQMAENINELIRKSESKTWYLAAEKSINQKVIKNLDPVVKATLRKNIAANLTKTDKSALLDYFS